MPRRNRNARSKPRGKKLGKIKVRRTSHEAREAAPAVDESAAGKEKAESGQLAIHKK